jgi:hypothetical protein
MGRRAAVVPGVRDVLSEVPEASNETSRVKIVEIAAGDPRLLTDLLAR